MLPKTGLDNKMWLEDRSSVLLQILDILGIDDVPDEVWDKMEDVLEPYTTGDYASYN